jgi:hypothetical protein
MSTKVDIYVVVVVVVVGHGVGVVMVLNNLICTHCSCDSIRSWAQCHRRYDGGGGGGHGDGGIQLPPHSLPHTRRKKVVLKDNLHRLNLKTWLEGR